jgi:formylglycine-generating enzyme required for sulfatase activity
MKKAFVFSVITVGVFTGMVSAELVRGIDIDFVTIGNAGNPVDTRPESQPTNCGGVDYTYKIGKYEVTKGQWDAFVSASGAPTGNLSQAYDESTYLIGDSKPANEVSWYEAVQFCNYLTSGDKSQGAYLFSGDNANPGDFLGVDRNSAASTYGTIYVLPTEDEWYKAAFYTGTGYSSFANGQDIIPRRGVDWNYGGTYDSPWDVGTGAVEQNGTFDMMGNVWEWNETPIGDYRGVRGGAYYQSNHYCSSYLRSWFFPHVEGDVGFRVAVIPEPATLLLLGIGGVLIRKRSI